MTRGWDIVTNDCNQNGNNESNKYAENNQLKIVPIKSKAEASITHYSQFNDAQGEDWSTWPRRCREWYADYIDKKIKPYFCALSHTPFYEKYSLNIRNSYERLVEQSWTFKLRTISNYHFQLHNNFVMLNSTDCIYNCKDSNCIERINMKSGEKVVYPGYRKVMCMDYDRNLRILLLGYNDNHYA